MKNVHNELSRQNYVAVKFLKNEAKTGLNPFQEEANRTLAFGHRLALGPFKKREPLQPFEPLPLDPLPLESQLANLDKLHSEKLQRFAQNNVGFHKAYAELKAAAEPGEAEALWAGLNSSKAMVTHPFFNQDSSYYLLKNPPDFLEIEETSIDREDVDIAKLIKF